MAIESPHLVDLIHPRVSPGRDAAKCRPLPLQSSRKRGAAAARHALLARLLVGCDVEALDDDQARAVGALAARAPSTDIVDVTVVEGGLRRHDLVVSSDPRDLHAIAGAAGRRLEIDRP